jgi:hypothetical protein
MADTSHLKAASLKYAVRFTMRKQAAFRFILIQAVSFVTVAVSMAT